MAEKITLEEALRRRALKEAKAKADAPRRAVPNGHDPHQQQQRRVITVSGWHELGVAERQDNMIAGLLGAEQCGMIYGESGSGKSFLTFDMCAHYARGEEWLGHKVKGGGVLYIAAEGRSSWATRVDAYCHHHGLDEEARAMIPFGFVLEPINLGRSGGADVEAVIQAHERWAEKLQVAIDLIVVDTMARATPGSNENDAGDMSAFVSNMDRIRAATKASQMIVHHSGKNAALGARGHSSLRAAVDLELEVERGVETGRILRVRKSRDGEDNFEQGFDLKVIEVGRDAENQAVTSCVVIGANVESKKKRTKPRAKTDWQQGAEYLNNAVVDFRVDVAPGGKLPTTVGVTTVTRFKETLIRAQVGIDSEDAATRRKQWERLRKNMQKMGVLRIDGDYCWNPAAAEEA